MTRVGVLEGTGLVGRELRDQLEARPQLHAELSLWTQREEGAGALTEIGGAAAIVQRLQPEDLEGLDLLMVCDPRADEIALLRRIPETLGVIVVSPVVEIPGGCPLIAERIVEPPRRGEILVSPHPAVVGLAHLLLPLEELGLEEVVATVLLPASMIDQEALEEMFAQTRALLEFKTPAATDRFPHQIAFNLLPASADDSILVWQLGALLRSRPRIAASSLQAGVFHGVSISAFCRLASDVGLDEVTAALDENPRVELAETPDAVGPVAAASGDTVLLAEVRPAPGVPGGFWLWAALGNLTRGGASNAVGIAERLLAGSAD